MNTQETIIAGSLATLERNKKQSNKKTQDTDSTLNALVDRTLAIIDDGLDQHVGDMTLMQAMEFVGVLMDIRERQQAYVKHTQKKVRACGKACVKMPKRK